MLNRNQFEIMVFIESKQKEKISQREIASNTNLSLGTVNKVISELLQMNLIEQKDQLINLTKRGYHMLEPYKVKRAIFLAAGFGSRLVPIKLNTPKPLVMVHGKKIIETLLDAVVASGIQEIIIVRGYLKDQFDVLLKKYPNIKFIDNDYYNEANNISSAYLIRNYVENAYIFESDLMLYNPNLIRKYEYSSNYLGKFVSKTDDWCFEVKNNVITKLKVGGTNCYHMYGISYFDKESALSFKKDVEELYLNIPGGKEKYWDQVHLDVFRKNYKFEIKECHEGDIVEIDTFNELKQIDKIYITNV